MSTTENLGTAPMSVAADDTAWREKVEHLRRLLRGVPSLLVAYSGGVDSSFLLRVALEELGERCVALMTCSAATPQHDLAEARALAADLGARLVEVRTDEVAIASYAENPVNRCYFCKDNLYKICHDHLGALGLEVVADGVNVDDLGDHRPGLEAAAEQQVRHPLVEAGLTKREIRAASLALGLCTHDKPASPCLASRFPYGTRITHDRLDQVQAAESALRRLGFREFRVRFEGDTARLEIAEAELDRCFEASVRTELAVAVREAGFARVVLDLDGFRSGSLNRNLPPRGDGPGST